ncbi:hypothetical protein [Pseudomonas syringae]|uniref:hypothetical protein n=1 Tax=Pseudomonas syringae TaxID=317 RepID=UPI0002ADC97D|nr:hypothetical protein [Pseudomonas syringae]ELS43607.1 Hypothetical protein PSSB64_3962 [Pseudomonas syringae pv. syringae B64]MBS7416413.1 hypothetical protein [Pseudomonas syringae]
MKDIVISVVSFFVWLMLVISTLVGFGLGSASGHEILGAIAGFGIGCFSAGFWFLLTSIHDKLSVLAEVAMKLGEQDRTSRHSPKSEHAQEVPNGVSKWTGQPLK